MDIRIQEITVYMLIMYRIIWWESSKWWTTIRRFEVLVLLTILMLFMFGVLCTAAICADLSGISETVAFNKKWADDVFAEKPVADKAIDHCYVTHEDVPGDTKFGRCAGGGPMVMGGKHYNTGVGVNSRSSLRVTLSRPAKRFVATIGLNDTVDAAVASVVFRLDVSGKPVFISPVMRLANGVKQIDVALDGAMAFDLNVEDGGDTRSWDQANWADAYVVFEDGSKMWLDEPSKRVKVGRDLPFSFVYGGKQSSQFINSWKRELKTERIDSTNYKKTLTLTDPETHLEVSAVATVYNDTPGVDWTIYFTNKGTENTPVIEQVRAVNVEITPPHGSPVVIHRLNGTLVGAEDWLPFDTEVLPGKRIEFTSTEGRVSLPVCPFYNVDWGTGGVITAFGWSGQWTGSVEWEKSGNLRIQEGMQYMHLSLHPGETIRSPRIMQMYWSGTDHLKSYNPFRRTMLSHIVPKIDGKTVVPPVVHLSTSFYELNNSNESNVLSHLDAIKGLGFEAFWLDAYYTRDGFPAGQGNYGFPIQRAEPADRFPKGLKPIGDTAHKEGMKFVLWFEPERVASGTFIARENPEWVMSPANDGSGLFNLGIPEAREFMTRYLNTVIKEYGIDCLRIDYNLNPLPYWQFMDEKDPERVGVSEIRYMEGLYRMWDDIRAANPHLFIDNCASGGCRIDLETCSRSIPLWRTDATIGPLFALDFDQAAIQNQVMSAGLNRYLPFSTSGMMGATPYLFRSGFNGGISYCEDVRDSSYSDGSANGFTPQMGFTPRVKSYPGHKYPRKSLKQAITEGKRIRKYYFGNFYPLSDVNINAREWCVLQYHRPRENYGMIVAFRRHNSPYSSYVCQLREINPKSRYMVTYSYDFIRSKPVEMKGKDLQQLDVKLSDCPGSVIVEYKILEP
jgi:alpha-galactosidase